MKTINAHGWTLQIYGDEQKPVAIHQDTGNMYELEYLIDPEIAGEVGTYVITKTIEWQGKPMPCEWRWTPGVGKPHRDYDSSWSQDWSSTPLDNHWGDEVALIKELQTLLDNNQLRVKGVIHGIPNSPLGAIIC